MFFERVSRHFRSIGVRVTFLFALVFTLCLFLILAFSYYFLSASLERKDREMIESRWKDYGEALSLNGVDGIEHRVLTDANASGGMPYVVGLRHGDKTLFFYLPPTLKHFDEKGLAEELLESREAGHWPKFFSRDGNYAVEAHTAFWGHHMVLTVGKSNRDRVEELNKYRRLLLLAILPILFLGLGAGFVFSKKALRPLRDLSQTVRNIYEGDINARVERTGSGDELDALGRLVNLMLERIQRSMQGMKDTLDNVAHDLRTPMTRFRGLAEVALNSNSADDQREALHECVDSSEQILRLLTTLMDLSSADAGTLKLNMERFDFAKLARDTAELYQLDADEKGVQLYLDAADEIWVEGDKPRIARALANLFDNAVKYTSFGGSVKAGTSRHGESALFRIRDTGCGIPENEIPRIWERLYRGDKSRSQKGMGLGLSIVQSIFSAHRGKIEVESIEGKGSEFLATIPLIQLS